MHSIYAYHLLTLTSKDHVAWIEDLDPVTIRVLDKCQAFHFTWNMGNRMSS